MSSVSVFVSRPTAANAEQESFCDALVDVLTGEGLRARTLGVTDYPSLAPLAEVLALMRQCSGALVLGLRQTHIATGEMKAGSSAAAKVADLYLATPWNQIEAGMAVALERPLLVARENGVEGGVFDVGSSDRFIHQVDFGNDWLESPRFRQPLEAWIADVRSFALTDGS
jgi:hypothetical protein